MIGPLADRLTVTDKPQQTPADECVEFTSPVSRGAESNDYTAAILAEHSTQRGGHSWHGVQSYHCQAAPPAHHNRVL
jgi:hypothetical protein